MPNRVLRDYTDSLQFDGISAEAERLFVRLIMKADDYGRYHADPRLIKAGCYPLQDQIKPDQLVGWLEELVERKLIICYEVQGRSYLAIVNFGQRLKQSRPKYPPLPGKPNEWLPFRDDIPELPGTSGNFRELPARIGIGDGDVKKVHRKDIWPERTSFTAGESSAGSRKELDSAAGGADNCAEMPLPDVLPAEECGDSGGDNKTPPGESSSIITQKAEKLPVEEPLIPPVSLQNAIEAGKMAGVPPNITEIWWHDQDGRGWIDQRGHPIRNWRSALRSYWLKWQNNQQQRQNSLSNPPSHNLRDREVKKTGIEYKSKLKEL